MRAVEALRREYLDLLLLFWVELELLEFGRHTVRSLRDDMCESETEESRGGTGQEAKVWRTRAFNMKASGRRKREVRLPSMAGLFNR